MLDAATDPNPFGLFQEKCGHIEYREPRICSEDRSLWKPTVRYHDNAMSKKPRKKKKKSTQQIQKPAKKNTRYSASEITLAVLGAALLVMVAGIVITSLLD
jgi:hypothetical protein